jgi:uncharacterized protein YjbI with pentapeptide repeats
MGAILIGAIFDSANLDHSSLEFAQGEGTSFDYSFMTAVNFYGAALDGADFYQSDLTGSDISWVMAPGANFDRAFLFGANLDRSFFRHSSFRGTQFQGAIIGTSSFDQARLIGVGVYRVTPPNLEAFKGSIVQNADSSARWSLDFGGGSYSDYPVLCSEELSMPDDNRCSRFNDDYSQPISYDDSPTWYFKDRIAINSDDLKNIIKSTEGSQTISEAEVRSRLEVLSPNAATLPRDQTDAAAWDLLILRSAPLESYGGEIAARLELIACAGGAGIGDSDLTWGFAPYVARGLLKSSRFNDDAGIDARTKESLIETLKTAMRSGRKPDGSPCPGAVGLDDEDFRR